MKKTRLLIDFSHLSIRNLFADREIINNPNPEFNLHRHQLITSLLFLIKKFNPNEVVLGIDNKLNWRKKLYTDYKAHRKAKRDQDVFPWDAYYTYLEELIQDIKDNFPFKVIEQRYAECDDIIAILCKYSPFSGENIVVTSDKDFVQLLSLPHVKIYDPIKRKFMEEKQPKIFLEAKILMGDKSDNIPAIKPRVGEKTAWKLANNKDELDALLHDAESGKAYRKNYKLNRILIDFNSIPDVIKTKVLKQYDIYEMNEFGSLALTRFFKKLKLKKLASDVALYMPQLKNMIPQKREMDELF